MKPKALLMLKDSFCVLFFILYLARKRLAVAVHPAYGDCEPKTCGGLNISYPFWLFRQQPPYCGYPAFNLTCKNQTQPVVNILGYDYNIEHIFYNNESVHLTPAELIDQPCSLPYLNLTYDLYPLSISNTNKDIYFLFNCSNAIPEYSNDEIKCSNYGPNAYYVGEYSIGSKPELNLVNNTCVTIIVPVVGSSKAKNYTSLLREGWLLDWTLPNCSECSNSGGQCGYNSSVGSFMCICPDQVHNVLCKRENPRKKVNKTVTIGVTTSIGLFILLGGIMFLLYKHKKKHKQSPSSKSLFEDTSLEQYSKNDLKLRNVLFQTHVFTYNELQEATNFFDISNELGDGGFGTVYKGKLRDGRIVAIKRLYENNYKRLEQFMNEVEILSRLHHPNLVSLYGCTSRHSRELLLVYEFVSNGTVADHLHGSRASEAILTWPMRLNIAIETADAVAYLHTVKPPIIHRDVKTNNILLDNNFHVKVADFGLSRPFPIDVTHVSTAPQGTPGYLDPEYHQCYQLTDKSDVYSFGVVLIELISSKPAIDITRQRSEINLANFAITKIQNGEVDQLIDPRLGYQSNQAITKMITMVAELAFRCLQTDGDMRPPIKEALEMLRTIENEGHKLEKGEEDARSQEDVGLLKNNVPPSPDNVIEKWSSTFTTPNSSE